MFLLLTISIAPSLALVIYFYHKDKYEKEPLELLGKAFLFGLFSVFIALPIELILSLPLLFIKSGIFKIVYISFIVAGFVEEFIKFSIFKLLIYDNKEFNEPYDGILYCVIISLGFATFENIMYVLTAFFEFGIFGSLSVGVMRSLFSVPVHAFIALIMGYFFSKAKFSPDKNLEKFYIIKGLLIAIFLHGTFDFFALS
ncbi:MAG: PrsW family glutamic-type intramembrane protease [Candidatus Omnitrophica bacterium]|nr:PrsW family glutamic-type intramembrane protease [Candidatus Omnitrophota bacterium]